MALFSFAEYSVTRRGDEGEEKLAEGSFILT
jgi:hypothetical protein